MDVLYPLKQHENNFELRYSLRSIEANLPHDRVFVCGFKPSWLTDDVIHIPSEQPRLETKYLKSTKNLIAAMEDERLSEDFILMNDDFFVMLPLEYVPTLHRESLAQMIDFYYKKHQSSPYTFGLRATFKALQDRGVDEPISYELHVPIVLNKKKFREILEISLSMEGFGKRTLYGNLNNIGGEYSEDVKFTNQLRPIVPNMPFLSTDEGSFLYHPIGGYIQAKFPTPSKYEKAIPWVKPVGGQR